MRAHWWSCVLVLLCMRAEVTLSSWTASQHPSSISSATINSSVEITCSTSMDQPMAFHMYGRFHGKKAIIHLHMENGKITKSTTGPEFLGRIVVVPNQETSQGSSFTLHLSLLGLEDTDLYYCEWAKFDLKKSNMETLQSNGTVVIVSERGPQEQCSYRSLDFILIGLSVTAFAGVLCLTIGALIVKCMRFKRDFRPARAVKPPRPDRPQHVCPQPRVQHYPYLITSESTLDFRGIL